MNKETFNVTTDRANLIVTATWDGRGGVYFACEGYGMSKTFNSSANSVETNIGAWMTEHGERVTCCSLSIEYEVRQCKSVEVFTIKQLAVNRFDELRKQRPREMTTLRQVTKHTKTISLYWG